MYNPFRYRNINIQRISEEMKLAVIDDERTDISLITAALQKSEWKDAEVKSFLMPQEQGFRSEPFDLYFLDIDMPEQNGFSLADELSETNPGALIVYCTSHDDLVFEAMKTDAAFFVRKHQLEQDLSTAYGKIRQILKSRERRYSFECSGIQVSLKLNEILYVEASRNYVQIHTKDRVYQVRSTMQSICGELGQLGFARTHASFLRLHQEEWVNFIAL
jgi:DNA-binding LytR/AlgR family response regulator